MKFFKWTISRKLIAALSLCALVLLGVGAGGIKAVHSDNVMQGEIYTKNVMPVVSMADIDSSQSQLVSTLQHAVMGHDKSLWQGAQADLPSIRKQMDSEWSNYYSNGIDSGEEREAADRYNLARKQFDTQVDKVFDLFSRNDYAGASKQIVEGVRPASVAMHKVVDRLKQINIEQVRDSNELTQQRYPRLVAMITGSILLGLLIMAGIVVYLRRTISKPLGVAAAVAGEITQGRLGHRIAVTSNDEIGDLQHALQSMSDKLVEIVSQVRDNAVAVSSASQQIARGNDDLSQRTQEQASSLEETASSMEEMTATVKQNSESAMHANSLANLARERAEQGGKVVMDAVAAMHNIDASSRRMADIVGLIDEIAFQTNLLALNAAVEAARAGEQGRGFAVVATEVRSLAQRSAAAAKQIKTLITESSELVNTGSDMVNRSGQALAEIVEGVKKVTDIVAEIAAASQEQSAGIDQVNNAVTQMDEVTQQNAALVEEASAAARAMQEQAAELRTQMSFFQLIGNAAPTPATKARESAVAAATEAVFAGVRGKPATPPNPRKVAEPVVEWAEF